MKKSELKREFANMIQDSLRNFSVDELLLSLEDIDALVLFEQIIEYSQEDPQEKPQKPTKEDLEVLNALIVEYREHYKKLV